MDTLDKDGIGAAMLLPPGHHQILSFGPFRLDPVRRVLLEAGNARRVGSRALEILFALAERAGQIVTKNELLARVWPDSIVQEATLRVHIAALRKVLGDGESGTRYVENFSGRGYRFVAEVTEVTGKPAHGNTEFGASAVAYAPPTPGHPAAPMTSARPADLPPARLTRMIGRARIVATLVERIAQRRFVTVVGPGGIGKTTVALAVVDRVITSYKDGIRFVDLAALTDPARIDTQLAAALGMPRLADDGLDGVLAFLRDKHVLIVLDNCEHVIEPAARLAEAVLRIAPNVHLLATSREPLRADGENVHRLAPLETPRGSTPLTRGEALEFPAIQLFVERAAASLDTFELRDADVPIVTDICRRLDGNPLAIELAAARMDLFDARTLAARLDERFRLLTRGRRTAPPRHQNLRASLDWSYELLSGPEKLMLRRLSMFASGFTLEGAIKQITDEQLQAVDAFEVLTGLVAKSLLTADFIGDRIVYRLMDTARVYGLEKLQDAGEYAEFTSRPESRSPCPVDRNTLPAPPK